MCSEWALCTLSQNKCCYSLNFIWFDLTSLFLLSCCRLVFFIHTSNAHIALAAHKINKNTRILQQQHQRWYAIWARLHSVTQNRETRSTSEKQERYSLAITGVVLSIDHSHQTMNCDYRLQSHFAPIRLVSLLNLLFALLALLLLILLVLFYRKWNRKLATRRVRANQIINYKSSVLTLNQIFLCAIA